MRIGSILLGGRLVSTTWLTALALRGVGIRRKLASGRGSGAEAFGAADGLCAGDRGDGEAQAENGQYAVQRVQRGVPVGSQCAIERYAVEDAASGDDAHVFDDRGVCPMGTGR